MVKNEMTTRNKHKMRLLFKVIGLLLLFVLAVWVADQAEKSVFVTGLVSQFGYVGLFAVSVVSGFNIVVPVPIVAFLPAFISAGLSFWFVLVVMTLGMTLGDTIGFLLGFIGRKTIGKHEYHSPLVKKILSFSYKHEHAGYAILLLYATLAPAPNEVLVVPMAFLGYKLRFMWPIIFVGNFVFNTLVAFGVLGLAGVL